MKLLRSHRQTISALMMLLMLSWQVAQPLRAATFYWDSDASGSGNTTSGTNIGGTGAWNTTLLNWWDGVSGADTTWGNGTTDVAIFGGTAGTVTTGSALNAGTLTFNSSGYVITGNNTNTLTLGTGGVGFGTGVTGATINAVIAGSSGLVFNGGTSSGTLFLNGANANTYSGTTTIDSGTLRIGSITALGTSGAGNGTTVNSGGALRISIGGTVATELLSLTGTGVSSGGALVVDSGLTSTWSGAITIASGGATINTALNSIFNQTTTGMVLTGNLTKAGAGTLGIQSTSSGTGTLTINAGTVSINGSGKWNSGTISVSSGGTLQNTGAGTDSLGNSIAINVASGGVIDLQQTGTETIGALTLNGTGINNTGAWVNNAATAGGAITATSITLGSDTTIGVLSGGSLKAITAITGGGFTLTKVGLGNFIAAPGTTGTVPFGNGSIVLKEGTLTLAPTIAVYAGTGANAATGSGFTYNGGGILALTKSTTSLSYTVGDGSAPATAFARSGKGTLVIAPTALANLGASANENFVVNGLTTAANKNGASTAAGIYDATVVAAVSNVGTFVSYGTGAGTGFAQAAYTTAAGPTLTTVANAIYDITGTNTITNGASGANAYAIRVGAVTATLSGTVTINGSAASSTNSGLAGVILNSTATASTITGGILDFGASEGVIFAASSGAGNGTIASQITGSAGITKFGAGTLVLSSTSNSFTGGININQGTLSVGADTNLGNAANGITFNAAANLTLSANGTFARALTLNNTAAATITISTTSGTNTISGAVSGAGGLTLLGTTTAATLTLSSTSNTFTGALRITGNNISSTVSLASIGDSSVSSIIFGGTSTASSTLTWTGAGITLARPIQLAGTTGGATINNNGTGALNFTSDVLVTGTGAKTLSLAGSYTATTNTLSGKIGNDSAGNAVGVTFTAGNWTLSAANTYSGATTVTAGTHFITGDMSGSISPTTINGGTLTINGTSATGLVTINSGGTYKLNGATGLNSAPITVNPGGTLTVDNTAASGGLLANRLNGKDLTMAGGLFTYNLGGSATAATDTINTLTAATGAGYNASGVTAAPSINFTAATGGASSVTVASLARQAGGTLLISGANLGTGAPGTGNTNLIVTANAASAEVIGGTGAAGSTTISINSFIIGQNTSLSGNAQFGFMTDKISGTILTNGLRNLTSAEYATTIVSGQTTLDNVSLSADVLGINSATTVNSLRLDTGTRVSGSGTLTVNSGGILALGTTSTFSRSANSISGGTLAFGTQEALFHTIYSDFTVSSAVTGSGGLTKSGDGLLILSNGTNNISGTITIAAGMLRPTAANAVSTTGAMNIANRAGAILDLTGMGTTTLGFNATFGSLVMSGMSTGGSIVGGQVLLGGGTTLSVGADNTSTAYGGVISGNGSFAKTGSGTLTFAGANVFTGTTSVASGGTLQGGVNSFLPKTTTITVNGTLSMNDFTVTLAGLSGASTGIVKNDSATARAITLGNDLGSVDSTYSGVFNAATAANLTLTKNGGGTLTLNNSGTAGTANGAWTFTAGTVKLDYSTAGSQVGNIINGSIAPTFSGGTLNVTGGSTASNMTQALGNVSLNAGGGKITMVAGGGAGTTNLSLGTLAGTTNGGTLLINAPLTTTTVKTSTTISRTTATNGRLVITTDGGSTYNWANNNGTAANALDGAATYTTNLVGSSTLNAATTDGFNSLITSTGSSQTTSLSGLWTTHTLKIDNTNAGTSNVLALGANNLVLDSAQGAILFHGTTSDFTISSSGGTIGSGIATNSDVIIHTFGTGRLILNAAIANTTGTGVFTKGGTGTLVLGAANLYTGATFINAGTLSISNVNQLGATAAAQINVYDGATLQVTGGGTVALGTHVLAFNGGNATIDLVNNGTTLTVGAAAAGTAGGLTLINSGSGTSVYNPTVAATYTGPTFIGTSGTGNVQYKNGVATSLVAAGGMVTVGANGSIDLNNLALSLGGLAGSGDVASSGASAGIVLTIGGNNLNSTYSGVLQNTGTAANLALTKTGAGTLTLTGVSKYTGATLVNGGILQLSGSNRLAAASAVTVGNVAGPVSTTLDIQNDQTLSAATALTFYGSTATNTTEARVNIGGTLTLQGNVATVAGASGTLGGWITGGTLTLDGAARTFTIVDSLNAADDLTITSVISSSNGGSLTKAGAGTLVLTGNNTMSGPTLISAGTLRISGTNDASAFNLSNSGAALNTVGGNASVGSLAGVTGTALALGGTLTAGADGTSTTFAGTVSGVGGLTKNGGGTLTLSGSTISYTGATIVNQGALLITGSSGVALPTSALTVAGSATFSLFNSAAQTINLGSGALSLGTAAQTTTLGLELGASTATSDSIVTTAAATTAGSIQFSLVGLSGFGSASTYDLIKAASGLNGATYSIISAPGGYTYSFSTSSGGVVQLSITPVAAGTLYWSGNLTNSWSTMTGGSTNWWTTSDGTTTNAGYNPGASTTVIFSTSNNAGGAISTTLDSSYTINDLKFNSLTSSPTSSVTIASGSPATNSLTIAPVSSSDGINVAAGSVTAGVTISAPLVLGATQTWTNSTASVLTLSGGVSGGATAGLTVTGSGIIAMSGVGTYLGTTTVNSILRSDGTNAFSAGSAYTLSATGTMRLNGFSSAIASLAGAAGAIVENAAATAATLTAGDSTDTVFNGVLQNGSTGTLALTKTGAGALTLAGANTFTGNTVVSAGTLNLTGSWTGSSSTTAFKYGDTAGNTIVNMSGSYSGFITTGANIAGSVAVFNQTAGTVTIVPTNSTDTQWVAKTGYGYLNITGGTFNTGRFDVNAPSGTSPVGVLYVGGTGTLNQNVGDYFIIGYAGIAQLTVGPGGSLTRQAAVTQNLYLTMNGTNSSGTLNVAGGTVDVGVSKGLNFGFGTPGNGNVSIVNVAGGSLNLGANATLTGSAGSFSDYFNFSGGTIKANAALTNVIPASTTTHTVVSTVYGAITNNNSASSAFNTQIGTTSNFAGGLTVNTNNFAVSLTNNLLGASGFGVTQAAISIPSTGNSGYIGAPAVIFSTQNATDVPASGYAVISGGQVIGIVITNPGVYQSGYTPTITLSGGGGSIAPFTTSTLSANSNTGGLIATGGNTLTLSGSNTFGGTVSVIGGATVSTNSFAVAGTASPLGAGTDTYVLGDASTAGKLSNSGATQTLSRGLTVNAGGGSLINAAATLLTIDTTGSTIASGGTLTLSSTAAGGITQNTAAAISGLGGLIINNTGTGVTTLNASNSYTGATTLTAGTLAVSSLADGGTNSSIGAATNVASNLVINGGVFQYNGGAASTDRLFSIGASFSMNASGTGALAFTNTGTYATPGTASARTLTLTGTNTGNNLLAGVISDSGSGANITSVTKTGAGTWVLAGANTYSGATTVTAGVLQFSGASALPSTMAVTLNAGTFSYRDDASGAIDRTANALTLAASGSTIDVGNNGGATTGSVVRFGALSQLSAAVRTLNFTGSNGYTVELASLALSPGAGQTTTLNPTTTTVSIVGNVTNGMSGFASNNFDTIVLSGSSTGNSISGVISDAAGGSVAAGGYTKITQNGGGSWRLSGQSTSTGAVAVQNGTLWLAGGDNRLNSNVVSVTLGTGTTSGKIVIGGNADGTTTAGSQRSQTFNQTSSTGILTVSGTGTSNSIVGGADGGTSAGTPANNSTLTLNIGAGLTDTYAGLIGWDGTGSVGFQNNINLVKSGAGTLILSGNLTNWTGTMTNTAEGMDLTVDATRPTITISGGVLRATGVINTVVLQTGGIFDDQTTSHGVNFYLKITGGLVTSNALTDNAADVVETISHGVYAFNFNNSGTTGVSGSDMYLGAVGARIFSGSALAAGSGNTYRFGGGAPWAAVSTATLGGSGGYLQIATTNVVTGANNVIIGDNGTYGGGLGIYGGNSTVEFTAAQNYTGTTTLAGGTLVVSNSNQLGSPTTSAGSIILDGGILRYSGITTDLSSRMTIANGGTIDTNGQNVTFASALANSNTGTSGLSSGGLTKNGLGTLTLTAASTYAGTTTVNGGILKLNIQTGSLTTGSALSFGGGSTFNMDNTGASGSLSQILGTLSFNAGDGVVLSTRTAAQSTTLTFASLPTRTSGATGNFAVTGTGSSASVNKVVLTSAPATNQFLNAGLYFGGVDFAVYDSTGYIRAINYSTDTNAATSTGGATLGSVTGKDLQLTTAAVTAQTTLSINSLKIAGAFGITIGSGQTLTIASGGLIKTGATATITGGTLATSGELVIRQDASTDALTISSVINSVGLTKSGLGTLTLNTSTNNLGNGQVVINGGTISVDSESRFGTAGTTYSGVTLNGGALTITGNSTISGPFTLGLGGGTITESNGNQNDNIGSTGDLLFLGLGARSLTLVGVDSRTKTFRFNIGDNGGPTSVTISGGGDLNVITLSGTNTYTGTTTITRGILRLSAAGQLPGGLGGTSLNTTNTGGGNLTFNGQGTSGVNRAILEVNTTVGDIYRSVGTGIDQIQWTGSGGFSNSSAGTTRIVNLGGVGAALTWGSGGFVPTGFRLQFGEAAANVGNSAGTIDFQNSINLGTASRTIDISNGTAIVEAMISGNLTFGSGGGLTLNTGSGALSLSGTNNAAGAATIDVLAGTLYFASTNAVLGTSGNITITGGLSSVVMAGATNPLTAVFASRIVTTSTGSVALDTNSSDTLNFSSYTALRLSAFNPANTAVYFTGAITPNGTTYRFGGQHLEVAGNSAATTLVLSNKNTLTGARGVDLAPGNLTITAAQNYSNGTVVNTSLAGGTSVVGVGSDAAFGTGTITVGGANTVTFGAVNGDRVVYNRIVDSQTAAVSFVLAGDQTSDGVANNAVQGTITYAGTLDLGGRATSSVLHSRTTHGAILLGNITNTTNGITLNSSTAGLFSILSTAGNGGVVKTFSGTVILGDATTLSIDSDSSLGTNGGLTMGSSTLLLQPGTSGTVTLAGTGTRTLTVTGDKSPSFVVGTGGTIVVTGAINGGSNLAARTFTKIGAGTLVLRGANGTYTGAGGSFSNTMQIYGGKLQLDAVNFTAASDRFIAETTLMPLTFGVASATLSGGGTLEIVHDASKTFALTQGFGNLTINQGSHSILLTNNNTTQALTLNLGLTFTRAAGGTMDFSSITAGGTNTIGSSISNNAGGIIGGYATFNGLDWAVQSGSNTIIALASGSYTTLVAASNSTTGNFILSSGTVALSTSGASLNTLKLVGSAGGTTLTLNGTNTLSSGGIIFDNTSGSATISGGTLAATGNEIIIFTGGTGSNTTNKLTLNAVLKSTTTSVTKSGAGTLVLAGANTYTTGTFVINAGTVEFSNGGTSQAFGNPTAGAANIILNGGVLRATATTSLVYGITVNGLAAIDVGSGLTLTQSAQGITGVTSATGISTGLLQKTGLGTLTLSGSTADASLSIEVVGGVLNLGKTGVVAVGETTNAYAALIVGNGAVANLTGTGGNQIADGSSVVVRSGGIFDVMGTGATATSESIDGLAGTGTVRNTVGTLFTLSVGSNDSSNLAQYSVAASAAGVGSTGLNNFGGVIQGNIALNKVGSGTQILSGNNTYSGSTTINEGTLKLGTTNALPSGAGKGDVTLVGDSTAVGLVGGAATVLAPGTLDLGGYNQAINGLNSTTGGYVVNNPTAGANISNTLTVGNGDANGAFNGVIMDGYTVGADSTTASPVAYVGTINLTKTGAGTQVLSGANTASGVLTVNQGEVDLNTTGTNAWSGNAVVNTTGILKLLQSNQILDSMTLTVAGGTFSLYGNAETVAGVSLTSGGFILDAVGGGALTSTTTFDLQNGTVSGILAGSVGISKTTSGTVVLSAANTFTGKTTVTGGILSISADNNLGVAPVSNVDDQLTLDGGTLQTTATLVIASTRRITAGASGGTFDTAAGTTTTVNSVILGSGPVTKAGAGTLIFTAVNTYTGKTSIQQGTLSVASLNSVATPAQSASSSLGKPSNAANGTIDVGSGSNTGTLVYTGTGETTDRVVNLAGTTGGATLDQSGTGAVKFTSDFTATGAGSKVLTLQGSTSGTGEISGAIVDNSGTNTTSVVKAGSGTWVFSGNNAYAGTTTINGGTLVISGTQASTGATTVNGGTLQVGVNGAGSITSSTVTVNSTGMLSGSGTIATSTLISSGGVLAPGDGDPSTGNATLTFSAATNSLTVANTGSIRLTLTTADSTDTSFAAWFHSNPSGTAAEYVTSIGGMANTGGGTSWNDVHSGNHDFISSADTIVLGSSSTTDARVVVSLNNVTGLTYGSIFNVMDWSTLGVTHDSSALSVMGAFNVANNLQLQDLSTLAPGLAWDTTLFDSFGILVVVPEPGRMLLLMLGLLGLVLRRRRRVG